MEHWRQDPNWKKYPPLLQLYQTVQNSGCELEPDPEFLADPRLGRYQEYQIKDFEIPPHIKDFLLSTAAWNNIFSLWPIGKAFTPHFPKKYMTI